MEKDELLVLIKELQALPKESEWVEFKGNNWNPDTLGANISAISNSALLEGRSHGFIVFGIQDESHEITGTTFDPDSTRIKQQEIQNYLATQLQPRTGFDIFQVDLDGKKVVLFRIDTPRQHPLRFKGSAHIRIGSYTKLLADHSDKEAKLWDKINKVVFEKGLATGPMTANEAISLIHFAHVFTSLGMPLPETRDAVIDKLISEKLLVKKHGRYYVTNLRAIMYAYDLNQFPALERKMPRVIVYKGKNKLETIKEQEGVRGYAVGFDGLVSYINNELPSNEKIGRVLRKEVRVFPQLAIRELVANALIHQNFDIRSTGVMIEIYTDRIEITNPGKPMIDTKRFIDHSPESRNEALAKYMRRIGICEERGSGIDKVIVQAEAFELPAPEFIEGDNYTRVKLYAPKTIRQLSKVDKIRATYQHCVIKYLSSEYMTNTTLRDRFGIEKKNYPQASRIIKQTIESKFITEYDDSKMYIPYWAT